jgi:small subunit ribosomal protein S6
MPLYEHTVIARPDLSAQQAQALAETFGEVIGGQGGKVAKVEYWGLRNLAYRVKKNRKGHYLHLNVEAPAAAIAELERTQRIHEDVLRYLTVKVEAFEEGPSQVMIAKSSRDERGGGRRDFGDGRGRDRDRDRDRGDRGDRDRGERGDRDRGEPRG